MPSMTSRRVRALVVEDDAPSRRAMVQLLRRAGLEVEATGTAGGAREKLADRPDCLVLDLTLSSSPAGLKLLRELREAGSRIRVAVTSGTADPAVLQECETLGAEVFRKPVDVEALARWILHG